MYFEKISFEQWQKDLPYKDISYHDTKWWYENIKLPQQGTKYSMGIDFFIPYGVTVKAHNKIKIPTGIRWVCDKESDNEYGMLIVPRSSIGVKLGLRLLNTIGVIDADYYMADNEGHIMLFFENTTDKDAELFMGQGIAQGLIINSIIPSSATSEDLRHGGFGSTDDNKN